MSSGRGFTDLPDDLRELCELFNAHRVDYVVVGAHALALHGAPRYTGDLDLLVASTPENAAKVVSALETFGFRPADFSAADLLRPRTVIQLGREPVRADITTSIDGVTWSEAWARKIPARLAGVPVHVLGREDLIASKRAAGRPKDLVDLAALGEKP